jgi:hypothetical protein
MGQRDDRVSAHVYYSGGLAGSEGVGLSQYPIVNGVVQ